MGRKEVFDSGRAEGRWCCCMAFLGRFELQVDSRKNAQVQEGSEPGAAEAMGNQVTAVYYFPAFSTSSQEASAT